MDMIQSSTSMNGRSCIQFVPRTNEIDYITIKSVAGSGCASYVRIFFYLEGQK